MPTRQKKWMILGFTIGFILLAGLIGLGVYYSNVIVFPPRYGLSHIPEDWDIDRENLKNFECRDIEFRTKDQIMLKGWYLPAKVDARKAILLVHGYGVNRWKVFEQVPFLHQAGYNLLLFDLRAHGESEGKYCSLGYYEQQDIHAAVKYLKEIAKNEKIGVLARSMGAATAILAMAENEDINAGIFESPFGSLKDILIYRGKRDYGLSRFPLTELAIFITEFRLKYRMHQVRPVDVIADIAPRGIFLIHGDNDDEVLPENSKHLYERAGQPREFWLAKGIAHTSALVRYPAEYKRRVLAFLDKHLNGNNK